MAECNRETITVSLYCHFFYLIYIFTVDLDDKLCLIFFFPVRPGFYLPFFNGRGFYLPFSNDGKGSMAEGLGSRSAEIKLLFLI